MTRGWRAEFSTAISAYGSCSVGAASVDWLQSKADGLSIAAAHSPIAQACPTGTGAAGRTRRIEIFECFIRFFCGKSRKNVSPIFSYQIARINTDKDGHKAHFDPCQSVLIRG